MTGLFGGGGGGDSGGGGGGGSTSPAPAAQNSVIGGVTSDPAGRKISSGGFVDDNAKRMPSASDKVAQENMRRLALSKSASSGRTSTNLSGTRTFVNTFLGSTG
jgi:hypothetical protein